jgi:L-aspartate oxidase
MEFIQFHPTAFYLHGEGASHTLISEAIRGYGAHLKNQEGERFMFNYNPDGELACRDVVARAIETEIEVTGHLDCRHLASKDLILSFPKIYGQCMKKGIDITKDLIPVIPAAHYLCGGIVVDSSGSTSINNLYALGECSDTGLHGANRLASNSLLEGVAFSEFCFQGIRQKLESISIRTEAIQNKYAHSFVETSHGIVVLKERVQNLMSKVAGISRTTRGLEYASRYLDLISIRLNEVYPSVVSLEILELHNMIICARLIVSHSLSRRINRGVFYNKDLDHDYSKKLKESEFLH